MATQRQFGLSRQRTEVPPTSDRQTSSDREPVPVPLSNLFRGGFAQYLREASREASGADGGIPPEDERPPQYVKSDFTFGYDAFEMEPIGRRQMMQIWLQENIARLWARINLLWEQSLDALMEVLWTIEEILERFVPEPDLGLNVDNIFYNV